MLSVLEAVSADRTDGSYLVVLTPCPELGDSVLAQAIEPGILPVNRWDLIRDAFGTKRLEPSLTRSANSWLAEALLDAQPPGGWRKLTGPVLGRETAMNRLAAVRLGLSADADDTGVDAAALLEWSLDIPAVSSFRKLRDEERDGITGWLKGSVGPVANVVFTMMNRTDVTNAVPFGLAVAALYSAQSHDQGEVLTARGRAVERYLGGQLPSGGSPPSGRRRRRWSAGGPTASERMTPRACASGPKPSWRTSEPVPSPPRATCSTRASTRGWPRSATRSALPCPPQVRPASRRPSRP